MAAIRNAYEQTNTLSPLFNLSAQEKACVAEEFNISPEGIKDAIRRITEIKASYQQEPYAACCGWLRTSRHGKEVLHHFQYMLISYSYSAALHS